MELSKETINFLTKVIKVAKILKIENVIVDHECVRGHFQEEGSMIIQRDSLPKFEFSVLGISRIDVLNNRLSLLGPDFKIDTEEKETSSEKLVYKLLLSKGKTKVEFKCADPAVMPKAPKILKDPIYFTFTIDEETVALLSKAQSAIRGETMVLTGSNAGVVCKLSDIEGDMLNHVASESLIYTSECDKENFYFSYKNKVLIPLLKESMTDESVSINITRRGILNIKVLGINIYIAPEL